MRRLMRLAPVVVASLALVGAACTPQTPGGGGSSNVSPVAVASASPTSGNVPLPVTLSADGSVDPDGTIVSYQWSVAGSTIASGAEAGYTFTSAGVHTVTLTVTDDKGATGTASVSISVNGDGDGDGYFPPADCDDSDPSIHPAADDPAGDDIDQNCDGIDGVQTEAVFVSSATGTSTSTCGLITEPCSSISQGQSRAIALGRSAVFVAGGTYDRFNVQEGLEIRGGYGSNFKRGLLAEGSTVAVVNGSFDPGLGVSAAIIAQDIDEATVVADLRAVGANESAARASYGVIVRNSTSALVLDSLDIRGGTGATGSSGNAGTPVGGSAASGSAGADAEEASAACSTERKPGGAGAVGAGKGGDGGARDTECGWTGACSFAQCDATPGLPGGNASITGPGCGTGGAPGASGGRGMGGTGQPGAPGCAGAPGASGAPGAATAGALSGWQWVPSGGNGGNGGLGGNGGGGGGGGGGGASDNTAVFGVDNFGAGGGGGGAGGVRATAGGSGGGQGYASIALLLDNSTATLQSLSITLGTGGKGGTGGAGATGQAGGAGGAGGAQSNVGGPGGAGGVGGRGGPSAGGGGGAGGPAIGILNHASTVPGGTQFSGGSGGSGGAGGAGPSGGNAGTSGSIGAVHTIVSL